MPFISVRKLLVLILAARLSINLSIKFPSYKFSVNFRNRVVEVGRILILSALIDKDSL